MPFIPNSEKTRKLLLLYAAEHFKFPLTEQQFIKIVLDNSFMNYVDFKESINELISVDHVQLVENAGLMVYKITTGGSYALHQFINELPTSTRESFHEYIEKNEYQIKTETLLDSSYKYLDNDQIEITCNIREKNSLLMSMKVYVGDKDTAKDICKNWDTASPMVYRIMLDTLLR